MHQTLQLSAWCTIEQTVFSRWLDFPTEFSTVSVLLWLQSVILKAISPWHPVSPIRPSPFSLRPATTILSTAGCRRFWPCELLPPPPPAWTPPLLLDVRGFGIPSGLWQPILEDPPQKTPHIPEWCCPSYTGCAPPNPTPFSSCASQVLG